MQPGRNHHDHRPARLESAGGGGDGVVRLLGRRRPGRLSHHRWEAIAGRSALAPTARPASGLKAEAPTSGRGHLGLSGSPPE